MKRLILVALCATAALVASGTAAADWPQYQFSARRTGFNPGENTIDSSNVLRLGVKWRTQVGAAAPFNAPISSPVVADGKVFVVSNDGNLYALDAATGAMLWHGAIGPSYIPRSPAVAGGHVYAASGEGTFAFPETCSTPCTPLWSSPDGSVAPVAVAQGVVYVSNQHVEAIDAATGATLWKSADTGTAASGIAVADGFVYASRDRLETYPAACSNPCAPLWFGDDIHFGSTPPAVSDGLVFSGVGTLNAYPAPCATVLVTPRCQPRWMGLTSDASYDSVAVAHGLVYRLDSPNQGTGFSAFPTACPLYCPPLWTVATYPIGTPTVANGLVYMGGGDDLDIFDAATGSGRTRVPIGGSIVAPAITDGVVYVSAFSFSSVATVVAVGLGPTPLVDTTPPTLSLPDDFTLLADNDAGAALGYTVSALDDHDPNPSVGCTPASGSTIPIGTTVVTCGATDFSGNRATGTFRVTVVARWHVSVSIDPKATIDRGTGTATVTGTVSCNRTAGVDLEGPLNEGTPSKPGSGGYFGAFVICTPPSVTWAATAYPFSAPYVPGFAQATVDAGGCELNCDTSHVTATVLLQRSGSG